MRRWMLLAAPALTMLAARAGAQGADTFEVASLKPSGPQSVRGWTGGPGTSDPIRYTFGKATLLDFVLAAYDLPDASRVSSKTSLVGTEFDLDARLPIGATKEQFRAMMRNLLAERFHSKAHIESREFSAYEMVVAKSGLKLKPSGSDAAQPAAGRPDLRATFSTSGEYILVRMRGRQETLSALARMLSRPGDPPVVDKTGLTDRYDFTLEYSLEMGTTSVNAPPPAAADLRSAVRDQLGLELIPKKLRFDVAVIDAIDKTPTGN